MIPLNSVFWSNGQVPSLLVLLFLISAIPIQAQSSLDAVFSPMSFDLAPGVAVLVRQNGRTVYEKGFGVRDLRTNAKIDSHTNFRLASFTKQFTAMSIMLLVHDGKLRYDQTLTSLYPDFPAWAREIRIVDMLTHTSGLPDYEEVMPEGRWTSTHQIQDSEVLDLLRSQAAPKFAAGSSWAYSNSAYVLLGLIVAKVSGESFPEFLQQRILSPLHMDHTVAYVSSRNTISDRAFGHSKSSGQFVETDQSSTSATLGDGGIYSNLDDLARWDEALEQNTLLPAREMKPARAARQLTGGKQPYWPAAKDEDNLHPGKPVYYGFGWFLDPFQGRERMWHSGSTTGFRTVIERFGHDHLSVIILANRTDLDAPKLAEQVAQLLLK